MSPATTPHRPFRQRLARNTVAAVGANAWAIVVAVATLPLMVHGLGVENFGRWVLLQTLSASTGWLTVLDGGLAVSATRTVAARAAMVVGGGGGGGTGEVSSGPGGPDSVGRAVGTAMGAFALLALLGATLTLGTAWPILRLLGHLSGAVASGLRTASLLLALQVVGELVQQGTESCLEGLQRMDLSRAVDATRRALFAAGTAAAALLTGSLGWVEIAAVVTSAVGALLGLAILARQRVPGRLGLSAATLREMFRYAKVVALLRPISALYRLMDRVIVGLVLGPAAVAAVEVATQLGNGADAMVSGITSALVPSAAWVAARRDTGRLAETLLDGTRYALLTTWPLAAGVAFLAGPGIRFWTGARLAAAAAGPARVALAAAAVAAVAQVAGNLLLGAGRGDVILRASLVGVTVDLIASVALVHPLGISGVFWGTLAAVSVTTPWVVRAACRECGVGPGHLVRQAVWPAAVPLVAECAALAACDVVPLSPMAHLAIGVGAGAACFAAAALRWALPVGEVRGLWRTFRGGAVLGDAS